MKYLKTYENYGNNQQPFWLSIDSLFISDDIVKNCMAKEKDRNKSYKKYNKYWVDKYLFAEFGSRKIYPFTINSVRWDKTPFKTGEVKGNQSYRMDIRFSKWPGVDNEVKVNKAGTFTYFLNGISGDSEMFGKSMINGTRWANYNFMCKLYPIFRYVKNGYKRLKEGELFLDIISELLDTNPEMAIHEVPEELKDKYPDYYNTFTNANKLGLI